MTVRFQNLSALVLVGTIAGCVTGAVDPMAVGPASPGSPNGGSGAGGPVGGAGTAATGGASSTPNTTPAKLNLTGAPKYYRVIRLSNQQWANSVKTVLGLATPTNLAENFRASVSGNSDFDNNELFLDIDNSSWQDFQAAAEALADQVTASDATLAKAYSGKDAAGLISTLGRRAYRRPLTSAEQAKYMTLYNSGSTLSGSRSALAKGASLVIRALLQSPNFLFRTELGATGQPLSGFEMAAKLSLWLKNTTPDDTLLDAAAGSTTLSTPDGAVATAKTMLEDAAAAKVMRSFHGQFLHLDLFSSITKDMVRGLQSSHRPRADGELVPVLRQDFLEGPRRQRHLPLDERLRRAEHGCRLRQRRDRAGQRLHRAAPRGKPHRLFHAAPVPHVLGTQRRARLHPPRRDAEYRCAVRHVGAARHRPADSP